MPLRGMPYVPPCLPAPRRGTVCPVWVSSLVERSPFMGGTGNQGEVGTRSPHTPTDFTPHPATKETPCSALPAA